MMWRGLYDWDAFSLYDFHLLFFLFSFDICTFYAFPSALLLYQSYVIVPIYSQTHDNRSLTYRLCIDIVDTTSYLNRSQSSCIFQRSHLFLTKQGGLTTVMEVYTNCFLIGKIFMYNKVIARQYKGRTSEVLLRTMMPDKEYKHLYRGNTLRDTLSSFSS
jgi:hypothetical protein